MELSIDGLFTAVLLLIQRLKSTDRYWKRWFEPDRYRLFFACSRRNSCAAKRFFLCALRSSRLGRLLGLLMVHP